MNRAIIKIGGSVLYDEKLNFNVELIKKFVDWFEYQKEYKSVVFVVGGGKLSRSLVDQVRDEVKQDSSRHQIGIAVTKVNARIVFGVFNNSKVKYFDCLKKLSNSIKNGNAKGAIIGGLKEGWSTDMVAANIAKALKLKLIFKVSNIDYIYTSDPNKNKDAKPLEMLSWKEYIKMFNSQMGKKHKPGMSVPIDIECAKYCEKNKIAFRISGGKLLNKKLEVTELFRTGSLVL